MRLKGLSDKAIHRVAGTVRGQQDDVDPYEYFGIADSIGHDAVFDFAQMFFKEGPEGEPDLPDMGDFPAIIENMEEQLNQDDGGSRRFENPEGFLEDVLDEIEESGMTPEELYG